MTNRWRGAALPLVVLGLLATGFAPGLPAQADDRAPLESPAAIPSVIYDSDLDFDDAATLAYLCREHKEKRMVLRAVTVTDQGMGVPGRALTHARTILNGCGLPDVPVAASDDGGVHEPPPEVQEIVEGILTDTLGDADVPAEPATASVTEVVADAVRRSPGRRVVLFATGPLSNVAAAVREHPLLAVRVDLHLMGGAFDVPGNLFGSTAEGFDNTQEFNLWIDPHAADDVLRRWRPLGASLVSLDATGHVPIREEYVRDLDARAETYEAKLVSGIMNHTDVAALREIGALYWWDMVAAVSMVRGGDVVSYETRGVDVVRDGVSAGRTVSPPLARRHRVSVSADGAAFEDLLIPALNGD